MNSGYYNAGVTKKRMAEYKKMWGKKDIWAVTVPPAMQTYAANNHMWISASNSCRSLSNWPSFFVRPDGIISGKLRNNIPGILISTVNTFQKMYDASAHFWVHRRHAISPHQLLILPRCAV